MEFTGNGGHRPTGTAYGAGRWVRAAAPVVCAAATVAALAGCSSSSDNKDSSASGPNSPSATSTSAPGSTAAADAGVSAGRPDDACTMMTSDQVAQLVGTPGPYTGAHEDPAQDGSPVWGCTWGTPASYADVREIDRARFTQDTSSPSADDVVAPLSGIGDKAALEKRKSDGSNPYVYFAAGGAYYEVEVVVDRRELGAANAPKEVLGEQGLAKILAAELAG
ncbi:DUF3558 family protein [Actinacidiphila acididurans]|uniref:DUF3558 family protein n=1 Tax=Actinacidiphila acididurans TaxID=2784346 RepID=A0ABS2U3P6_9ACTN|nr:DUF3558 family protein [Actinacidiphila acididurans]MBM9510239.1 DUF3558 family protein [Actinacidiphila acididurans]